MKLILLNTELLTISAEMHTIAGMQTTDKLIRTAFGLQVTAKTQMKII
tara:strand:+ start:160 stop:303 length:144 start_codon:yes stop_codon:yes gene_type:complete